MSSSIEIARHTLLSCGLILAIGTVAALFAQKVRIPDVAVFLIVGILIGPHALGLVNIAADSALNQIILLFGASYILFDGGATLRLTVLRQVWITIAVIATLGVIVTAAITGFAAQFILGVPPIVAFLLAATLASTDPATLVPIFRQIPIRDRVAQTVMSESAFNDAMGAIITLTLLGVATGSTVSVATSLRELLEHSIIGITAGIVLGYLATIFIAHEKWAFLAEYAPVVTVVAVIAAYFAAEGLHASGFMAVFVFGIMLGNKETFGFAMEPGESQKLSEFVLTTAFILRLFIFILLGAQVNFVLMHQYWLGGVAVTLVLMFVARPITVFLCAMPDRRARWSLAELLFMCWTRETGVIPAALAGLMLGMKAPGAEMIASVTFVAILTTILIQASTTRWLASKLGLLETDEG
ncbi:MULTISPECIES: sodium:proton antiporter [unclassified Bradyrhizobium]|uniref:cation:proton antiporter n=1 Tax=unclassified Bradyrhizobium TaxID=2631580 RepID=UPI001BAC9237|nr:MULTISPECIES: sodium:proton antiporter [unclassified Bradyrhizobium]MBR1206479.1 sodium:proton antiporter [Bradyrhizobium sp. AUGA SZCCT0124]MBR1315543.1 sodium:proton antiporter [Bradyrhizobium sp. AUGA SZCCT0051]MBR1338395.1 sodium:proton antiporter [Bradyrhizobium sp. AUGA SZCCT0105]MBR1356050.1 sodium:proton antiporter [Bradyrhizobium sp. AUGA SZCCT0045]